MPPTRGINWGLLGAAAFCLAFWYGVGYCVSKVLS